MSKIGRRSIALQGVKLEKKGQEVHYSGKNASGVHMLPEVLDLKIENEQLYVFPKAKTFDINELWGLHRALLFNKITGARSLFEKQVQIVGLGFKAIAKGKTLEFSLGYSHKIDVAIPDGVTVEIDKTGQMLTFRSANRELVGKICGDLRKLRPVEPYKGTGIRLTTDVVIRKAGKAKGS
jgi:large subunit ribosomal protein L6